MNKYETYFCLIKLQRMAGDMQWSETGDRYMLKLFRDYVFHQVTPNGHPWVDLSHVIQCLNKVNIFYDGFNF